MLLEKIEMLWKMCTLTEGFFILSIFYNVLYTLYPGSVMLLDCIYVFKILKYFEYILKGYSYLFNNCMFSPL